MPDRSLAVALLAALLLPTVPRAGGAEDPLARFGWMRDLAGACWSGSYGDGAGKTSDTQCYEVQWGKVLRGRIQLTGAHQGEAVSGFEGDSVFAWSRKKERIVYTTWSSDGGYGTGEAYVEGAEILFPDARKEGQPETRSRWTRLGPDAYQVVREKREGEGWREVLKVVYRRAAR